jgi:hypothetical protein
MIVCTSKISSFLKSVWRSRSKLCALLPRESIFCDVSHALVISSIILLIFFSTYPLHYARKLEDPITFVARVHAVADMFVSKELPSDGIGTKLPLIP